MAVAAILGIFALALERVLAKQTDLVSHSFKSGLAPLLFGCALAAIGAIEPSIRIRTGHAAVPTWMFKI
jgi:hypothetical protein